MELPKFLLADTSALPDDIFVLHTEYPRFVLNLATDDVEWFDDLEQDEEKDELLNEVSTLIEQAERFYEEEMRKYEED